MISPLKNKPVNWIDGMKISSNHFINTDNFIHDIIRDANSVHITNHNFGLLPPVVNESASLDIQIIERASNQVQIRVNHCNAVTAEGFRIDISRDGPELELNHYFGQENAAENSETYYVLLTVNPFERVPSGNPDPEESPLRYPTVDKKYHISIMPASQINTRSSQFLEVGKFIKNGNTLQTDINFIPPCTSILSHPQLVKYYELFGNQLNTLQLLSFRIIDKITAKESVSTIGKNVKILCEKMLEYIARIYSSIFSQSIFTFLPIVDTDSLAVILSMIRNESSCSVLSWLPNNS